MSAKLLVFPAHSPDEAVTCGTDSRVDRPRRRKHRIEVANDQVPRVLRLAHDVKDHLVRRDVKIQVHLGPAQVGMGRHRVPDASGLEKRDAHDNLAGLKRAGMDHLVEHPLVGVFPAAQGARRGSSRTQCGGPGRRCGQDS